MQENVLRSILKDDEIKAIEELPVKDRRHPVKQLLQPRDEEKQVLVNTNLALKRIMGRDKSWLESIRHRLTDTDQFSASSSVLGEIRAYGYLLDTLLQVKPMPETDTSTPDFRVICDDNDEEVIIEVHSKQYDGNEESALEKFNTESISIDPNKRIAIREHVVTPFGKPRINENVSENVISRLAKIKQTETQFSVTLPSVLWLDFQDDMWKLAINADGINPIHTWNSEIYVGVIWYAFYGFKDAPIFEGHSTKKRAVRDIIQMRHNGRFRNNSKIDGVVFSFPRSTFAIENPYSQKPIPDWFWTELLQVPWFQLEHSRLNWPDRNLLRMIELETERIEKFARLPLYKW